MSSMAKLSTHVLDTVHGRPAAGMAFRLERVHPDPCAQVLAGMTDADGRSAGPLLSGDALQPGVYALHFDVAAYFRRLGVPLSEPPFLDVVTLRFGVADASGNYHVPLLVSPWAYSTYRGS
jgi:5-hydroxyisourate hydrolase